MKKILKKVSGILIAIAVAVNLGACSLGNQGGEQTREPNQDKNVQSDAGQDYTFDVEPVELTFACNASLNNDSTMSVAIHKYVDELEKWTDGNMIISIYDSGQLGGDLEMVSSLQQGTIDIYWGNPANIVPLVPEFAVLDIGGLYENSEHCNRVVQGGFMDIIQPYCNAQDMQLVSLFSPMFRELSSNTPVKTAKDLKGLKIRVQENKYHQKFWEALGCSPIPLGMSDLYIGLQQGMVTACENPWGSIWGNKLYEVQKYAVETDHIPFIHLFAMNQGTYNGLSDTQKQALKQWLSCIEEYNLVYTAGDDEGIKDRLSREFNLEISKCPEEIRDLYPAASQAVVKLIKENLAPGFVDQYLEAVERVKDSD